MISELDQAITHLERDSGVGAIIITGAGDKAFSAGADIHENRQLSPEGRDELQAARANYNWHLATCAKPVIGAINGLCYGGGTVLATAMDFLVGCERTCFRFLAVNYGQMNATWSLPMLVGWARAKELLYTGREVGAEEAYHIGLINHLFPSGQLTEKTMEIASAIARNPPGSVANIKQMLMEHTGRSLPEKLLGRS